MNTFTFWYKTCDGTHTFQSHLEFLVCETHNHGSLFACVSIKVSVFLPLFLFLFFFSNFLGAKSRNNTFDLKKFFVYPLYIHSFWLHDIFSKFGTCLFTHFMISSDASVQFSSVTQSCPTLCNPRNRSTPGLSVHHQLLESTQTNVHRVDDAISFSIVPFSSCPQSFPASESFQMSQLFPSGGQSIGVSASTSALPINTQD